MSTLTYRGDAALKDRLVERALAHQAADRFLQGSYVDVSDKSMWTGCAIGCTVVEELAAERGCSPADVGRDGGLTGEWHETWARVTGLPEWLARSDDVVFEDLDERVAPTWPARLLAAVPVGVDLEEAREALTRDLLFDTQYGIVAQLAGNLEQVSHAAVATTPRALPVDAPWPVLYDLVKVMPIERKYIDPIIHAFAATHEDRVHWVIKAAINDEPEWVAGRVIHHLQQADVVE